MQKAHRINKVQNWSGETSNCAVVALQVLCELDECDFCIVQIKPMHTSDAIPI